MNRDGPAKKVSKASKSRKASKTAQPAQRTKEQWIARVPAIDSPIALAENRRMETPGRQEGWGALIADLGQPHMRVNIKPLCEEFDKLHRVELPKGMKHFYDEPAIGHLTQHMCWEGKPTEQVCAAARSIFVLGQAARVLRPSSWRKRATHELVTARNYEQRQERAYMALSQWLRGSMALEPDDHLLRCEALRFMDQQAAAFEARRLECERLLATLQAPPALVGAKATDRPWLCLAEGELLKEQLFDPARVGELIVVMGNKSRPASQVYGRIPLLRWEMVLSVHR